MRRLREWIVRFGGLFNKQPKDRELDAEIESHLQMHIEDNVRSGMNQEEARRQAMIKLGGIDSTKEAYRDQRSLPWMEMLWQDIRFGARQFFVNPGFTVVAVVTLAVGIGANTAIFSLANSTLFRPAPFPEPDSVYYLHTQNPLKEITGVSAPDFIDWQKQTSVFARMAAFRAGEFSARVGENSFVVSGASLSEGFLDVLGVRPVVGRDFRAEEYVDPNPRVVMIGHRFWARQFNEDPAVVGKVMRVDGESLTIIGVLPKGMGSLGDILESAISPDICLPLNPRAALLQDRGQRSLKVIARLNPGLSRERAENEATVIGSRLVAEYPAANNGHRLVVNRWDQERKGDWKGWLFFMGLIGSVLLIACANVANLLLARSFARGREIGIRVALGAGRLRVIRQLLTESLLLALAGGTLGIVLSQWAARLLIAQLPSMFFGTDPKLLEVAIDWRVLSFVLGVSVSSTLLFGLIPALQASRVDINRALQEGGHGMGGNLRQRKIRQYLVVGEVAIALSLLIGAVTMTDGFLYLLRQRIIPGFETHHLAYARLAMLGPRYETVEQRITQLNALKERLKNVPGIESVAIGSTMPKNWPFEVRPYPTDRPPRFPGETIGASCVQADPQYFKLFNIPAMKGRLFDEQDRAGSPPVAIINEPLAKRLFKSRNPLGEHITLNLNDATSFEVVGVVHFEGEGYPSTIFVPVSQRCWVYPNVIIRTASHPGPFLARLRAEVRAMDPDQPTDEIATVDNMLWSQSFGYQSGVVILLGSFAGVGFLLAIVGVGSVVAYAASQRTREIGIRLALGGTRKQILVLMLRETMAPFSAGLGIGMIISAMLQRMLWTQGSFFPGWEPNSPMLFALVIGTFGLVALIACCFPAHRATKVDPMITLRCD